jgi:hypothetical protein
MAATNRSKSCGPPVHDSPPHRGPNQFTVSKYYGSFLRPVDNNCGGARYYNGAIEICYWPGMSEEYFQNAVNHEMFHAFQLGYFSVFVDSHAASVNASVLWEEVIWLLESTATAAAASDTEMRRTERKFSLRSITTGLVIEARPSFPPEYPDRVNDLQRTYEVQDFWVYFGQKRGHGLDYLQPLFERGATLEQAAAFFAEIHPEPTSLGAEYWAWVKNQAIERTIPYAGLPADKCKIEGPSDDPVIGPPRTTLSYPDVEMPVATSGGILRRLTAEVVKVDITTTIMKRTAVTATADITDQPGGALAFKVYATVSPTASAHSRRASSRRVPWSTSSSPILGTSPGAGSITR